MQTFTQKRTSENGLDAYFIVSRTDGAYESNTSDSIRLAFSLSTRMTFQFIAALIS